jgi:hypothetical protein
MYTAKFSSVLTSLTGGASIATKTLTSALGKGRNILLLYVMRCDSTTRARDGLMSYFRPTHLQNHTVLLSQTPRFEHSAG